MRVRAIVLIFGSLTQVAWANSEAAVVPEDKASAIEEVLLAWSKKVGGGVKAGAILRADGEERRAFFKELNGALARLGLKEIPFAADMKVKKSCLTGIVRAPECFKALRSQAKGCAIACRA